MSYLEIRPLSSIESRLQNRRQLGVAQAKTFHGQSHGFTVEKVLDGCFVGLDLGTGPPPAERGGPGFVDVANDRQRTPFHRQKPLRQAGNKITGRLFDRFLQVLSGKGFKTRRTSRKTAVEETNAAIEATRLEQITRSDDL